MKQTHFILLSSEGYGSIIDMRAVCNTINHMICWATEMEKKILDCVALDLIMFDVFTIINCNIISYQTVMEHSRAEPK
jgi:hypothetical protein